MISTISIVGADDGVCPSELADISLQYPFVEWCLNICSSPYARDGFPSEEWLHSLSIHADKMRLIGFLHGRWKHDILDGNLSIKVENPELWSILQRIQIDVSKGHRKILDSIQLIPEKEFALITNTPNSIICGSKLRSFPLLPKNQLFTYPDYCGYQISDSDIESVLKDEHDFWVSVEGFRTAGRFDLLKVERFLDYVEDYISSQHWVESLMKTNKAQKRYSESKTI